MTRPGYVYVLHPIGHNAYKIGCTVNLKLRLQRIQHRTDYRVEYVVTIWSENYNALEEHLHRRFSRYRLDGEWFALSEEHICYLKSLAGGAS